MPVNWRQPEISIVINDKSQGSIANHLSWGGFLHDKFIIQFPGERIFKIDEHLAKLQAKWPHSPYTFVLKDAEVARYVK